MKLTGSTITLIVAFTLSTVVAIVFLVLYIIQTVTINNVQAALDYTLTETTPCNQFPERCQNPNTTPPAPTTFDTSFDLPIAKYCAQNVLNFELAAFNFQSDLNLLTPLTVKAVIQAPEANAPVIACVAIDSVNSVLYVFIRGTETQQEWLDDLKFQQVTLPVWFGNTPGVLVHDGFLNLWLGFQDSIMSAITDSLSSVSRVVISGHSLGGALASLCALLLSLNTTLPIYGYTFGKPRVGNIAYAAYVNSQATLTFWRVQNGDDLVPQVPLSVTPNFSNKTNPWIYEHEGFAFAFEHNWSALPLNHDLPLYINTLDNI